MMRLQPGCPAARWPGKLSGQHDQSLERLISTELLRRGFETFVIVTDLYSCSRSDHCCQLQRLAMSSRPSSSRPWMFCRQWLASSSNSASLAPSATAVAPEGMARQWCRPTETLPVFAVPTRRITPRLVPQPILPCMILHKPHDGMNSLILPRRCRQRLAFGVALALALLSPAGPVSEGERPSSCHPCWAPLGPPQGSHGWSQNCGEDYVPAPAAAA